MYMRLQGCSHSIMIELSYLCDCYLCENHQVGCTVIHYIKILCYMFSIVILINLSLIFFFLNVFLQAVLASLIIAQMLSMGQRKPSSSNHINCKSKLRLSIQKIWKMWVNIIPFCWPIWQPSKHYTPSK